jgi:hypothetical protein
LLDPEPHPVFSSSGCKSNQRILDVASWKGRIILADLTTLLYEPDLGFFDALNRHFQKVQEAPQLFQGGELAYLITGDPEPGWRSLTGILSRRRMTGGNLTSR